MRLKLSAIGTLCLALVFCCGCTSSSPPPKARPKVTTSEFRAAVRAENQFALDLFESLRKEQSGNLFFCPLSIAQCLAMAHAGAAGGTEQELARVLHLDGMTIDRAHAALGALGDNLLRARDGSHFDVANAMWVQRGLALRQPFVAHVQRNFGAEVGQADFRNPDKAQQQIDKWVNHNTRGIIKSMDVQLAATTRLVLTNAVHFLGKWTLPFEKENTSDEPFTTAGGAKPSVPMMHQTADFKYAADDSVQLLELRYRSGNLSMLIFLPRKDHGLPAVEAALPGKLQRLLGQLKETTVIVSLPRFKMGQRSDLAQTIRRLGAPIAFSQQADFSRVTPEQQLFIAAIVHRAIIDVDEAGTEAAAATEIVEAQKDAATQPKIPEFRADHPFLFLIRDTRRGTNLFIGRLADPS